MTPSDKVLLVPYLGYISVDDLKRVIKDLGESVKEDELKEMIEWADVLDKDGVVSEEEFYRIITSQP